MNESKAGKTPRQNVIKAAKSDRIFIGVVYAFMVLFAVCALYPVYFVIIASLSGGNAVATGKVFFVPIDFTWNGYREVFANNEIIAGYGWTILLSVTGTLLNLLMTIPLAYILSRKDFMARNLVMWLFLITMYFGGGLIPTYVWLDKLGLNNNLFVLLLPGLVSPFNLIVSRAYFSSSLPNELYDAARVDGCNNVTFFCRIALPLAKPIVAVIALYCFVGRWNDWFNPLIYLSGTEVITGREVRPLALVLRNLLMLSQTTSSGGAATGEEVEAALVVKYAVIVVSTLPVMCFYPFVQKHFTQGVMVGSVKG